MKRVKCDHDNRFRYEHEEKNYCSLCECEIVYDEIDECWVQIPPKDPLAPFLKENREFDYPRWK